MEKLLNKLIEKGWKPRNIECTGVKSTDYCLEFYTKAIGWISKDERHLVSKESWLWQFVCENEMVEHIDKDRRHHNEWNLKDMVYFDDEYEYRIIESALCDEDKLEQFLLENIKVE